MKIEIKASPKEVRDGHFNYSNMESEYGCNTLYFTKNGKPYSIIAGEMHFARVPKERWKETLLKMRECGVNTVSSYVFWNYHEEIKGQFDFSGNKDIAGFLELCKEIDMTCILRIGPWCHAEVVYGDFPKRINKMIKKRTNAPEYLAEVKEYWQGLYKEVIPTALGTAVKKNSSRTIVLPSLRQEQRTKSAEIYSKVRKPKTVCLTTFLTALAKQDRVIR